MSFSALIMDSAAAAATSSSPGRVLVMTVETVRGTGYPDGAVYLDFVSRAAPLIITYIPSTLMRAFHAPSVIPTLPTK